MILMLFSQIIYHLLSHLHIQIYIHMIALCFFYLNYINQVSGYFRFLDILFLATLVSCYLENLPTLIFEQI